MSPGSTEKRRTRVPRAEREVQMLDVAEQVFGERGFSAATMDEIAEKVGVTKPLIYDYFGSKEGLLTAVVERSRRALLGELMSAWQASEQLLPRERVRTVIVAFFHFMDTHDRSFIVLRSEGALVGEAGESIERIRIQTAKALGFALAMIPELRDVPERRLAAVAEIIIGGCERLAVYRATDSEAGMTSDESADLVMAAFWDGLPALAASR